MIKNLTDEKIKFLEEKARDIRVSIIEMLVSAGSGHSAGPLGMADVFTALYFLYFVTTRKSQSGQSETDLYFPTDTYVQ